MKKKNKKYISEIKVRNFMEEQMTRIENLNQRIDKIIAKDEEDDYLFELDKFNCSHVYCIEGSCISAKKLIDDSVKKNKGY